MFNPLKIFGRGYDSGESSHVRADLGWGRCTPCDEDNMIGPDRTRETSALKAIDLMRNGQDNGVCNRIAQFAIGSTGLRPQALTSSEEWNSNTEDWWNYIYGPSCDSRGRVSMWRLQWQAVSCRPTMGGVYWQLLSNGKIRPIEPERIRNPKREEDKKNCFEGVKVNPDTGEIIGYWVHSRDKNGGFSGDHKEVFVKAENMIPVIAPPWRPDQIREMPDFSTIVPHMKDMAEANRHTLNTMKTQSKLFAWLSTSGSNGPLGGSRNSNPMNTVNQRKSFQLDALEVMHLNPNETLNMGSSPTPSATHIPYMQMQAGLAAAGINYPYEFYTYDFSKCDFSRMRAVVGLINRSSEIWRTWLAESLDKLYVWRVAMAIRDKEIPPAPVGKDGKSEWNLVDWQAPEDITIDRQAEIQADTLEFQMRQNTMSSIARRRGKDYSDVLRQQARDWKLEEKIADEEDVPPELMHPKAQIPGQTSNAGPIGQPEKDMPIKHDDDGKEDKKEEENDARK